MTKSSNLSFGEAIELAQGGQLITRSGWNGKGMFLFIRPGDVLSVDFIKKVKTLPDAAKDYLVASGQDVTFTAYFCMKAADGTIVNGWLASQTDMLANDWQIFAAPKS